MICVLMKKIIAIRRTIKTLIRLLSINGKWLKPYDIAVIGEYWIVLLTGCLMICANQYDILYASTKGIN